MALQRSSLTKPKESSYASKDEGDLIQKLPAAKEERNKEAKRRDEGDARTETNLRRKQDGRDGEEGRLKYEEEHGAGNECGSRKEAGGGSRKDYWRKVKKEEKLMDCSVNGNHHSVRPLHHYSDQPVIMAIVILIGDHQLGGSSSK